MVCVFFPICVSYFIKNQNKEKNKQKNKNRKERKEEKRKHTKRKRKERKNKPGKKVKDRDSWLQLHLTWLAHLSNLEPTTAGLVGPRLPPRPAPLYLSSRGWRRPVLEGPFLPSPTPSLLFSTWNIA